MLRAHRDGDGDRALPLLKKASAPVAFLVLLVNFLFCPMVFLRFEKREVDEWSPIDTSDISESAGHSSAVPRRQRV